MTRKQTIGYIAVVAGCFVLASILSWTNLAVQLDNDVYDFMLRLDTPAPRPLESVLVTIDDATFQSLGGVQRLRSILAEGLDLIAAGSPKAVAVRRASLR